MTLINDKYSGKYIPPTLEGAYLLVEYTVVGHNVKFYYYPDKLKGVNYDYSLGIYIDDRGLALTRPVMYKETDTIYKNHSNTEITNLLMEVLTPLYAGHEDTVSVTTDPEYTALGEEFKEHLKTIKPIFRFTKAS